MQYTTIVLELIQDRPQLHQQLASSNTLLSTMNQLAGLLRGLHQAAIDQLRQSQPDQEQRSSTAMELALAQFEQALPQPTETEPTFSLDAAMAYIRKHTPPA